MEMTCPECKVGSIIIVDGRVMSQEELLNLPRVPKKIERRLYHKEACAKLREEWITEFK